MNRAHLFSSGTLLLVPVLLVACSTGEDITLHPASTSAGLSCMVSAGENICDREFDFPDDKRERLVRFLQLSALVASVSHDVLGRNLRLCETMASELGVTGVALPEDGEVKKRSSACGAVRRSVESADLGVALDGDGRTCGSLGLPPCLDPSTLGTLREGCKLPSLLPPMTITRGASPSVDQAEVERVHDVLDRHVAEIASIRELLGEARDLVTVATHADYLVPLDEPSASCVLHAADMLRTAASELVDASNAFAQLGLPNTP